MFSDRPLLWLVVAAFIVLAAAVLTPEGFQERRPRATTPEEPAAAGRDALPGISLFDPAVRVEVSTQRVNSTGTAFSLIAGGNWVTARHVVDGCDRLLLEPAGGGRLPVVEGFAHSAADLAMIRTESRVPSLPIRLSGLQIGQPGFHYGFPKGRAGAAASLLLGRRWMRVTGAMRFSAPVIVWSETERVPATLAQLGGMSGGPVLDAGGRVVGVTVASSLRRGRIFTAAPASMRELIELMGQTPEETPRMAAAGTITNDNFIDYATTLMDRRQVARVRCRVDRPVG